jgi:hypothetical protein
MLALSLPSAAQPGWKDCATATHYRLLEDSTWQEKTGDILLCYDTHAFTFKIGKVKWYTGIVRYRQHLEKGYLVEEFYSEENNEYPESEFRFHIVRSSPAVVTVLRIPTGETWQILSGELTEVKLDTAAH